MPRAEDSSMVSLIKSKAIELATLLVALGVSWGIHTSQVNDVKREMEEFKRLNIPKLIYVVEQLSNRQDRSDREATDTRREVVEIQRKLDVMASKIDAIAEALKKGHN
jgi:hypothetical protein